MKQLIVLKMDMISEKSMKKAMKIASGTSGVRSVSIQGRNDQLVVLGEWIDTAELTLELRKKVCYTTIVAVQSAPSTLQPHFVGHQNEMVPARRCICDIPNSGLCWFCRSAQPYYPPVIYGGYRDDHDGCRIL